MLLRIFYGKSIGNGRSDNDDFEIKEAHASKRSTRSNRVNFLDKNDMCVCDMYLWINKVRSKCENAH